MSEHLWYIKHCELFGRLTDGQLGRLEQSARMRRFPKGAAVYLTTDVSDGVFLLAEGRVKLCSYTADGKEAILALIEPGELFGELAIFDRSERDEHAEAVTDSTIVLLPGAEVERLMAESPELALGITKFIGFRRKRIERRLKNLLFRSIRERLVYLLLDLAEQYGRVSNEGVVLGLALSHQDLAAIIGLTRETVTVYLGELRAEGLVKISRQKVIIRDLPKLAQSVGTPPPRIADPNPPKTKLPPKQQVPTRPPS
jgi:CRP/FNR family cyclic AMP-dependent transcriptional regulator